MSTTRIDLASLIARLEGRSHRIITVADDGTEVVKTFDELHRDTQVLIRHLRAAGLGPPDRIGILAPNSYDWIVWDLAITAVGCTSVAFGMDHRIKSPRVLTRDYHLRLCVVDRSWVDIAEFEAEPAAVDIRKRDAAITFTHSPHTTPLLPSDTHSLVFSSGTTGQTKGLIISRRGTEHLLQLYTDAFGAHPDDRFLTFLPFANYQQRMAYYYCFHHGIDLVYVPFPLLFPRLKTYQPTYIIAPPLFYESVHNVVNAMSRQRSVAGAAAPTSDVLSGVLGGRVRYLVTGMAPIKRKTLQFFWDCGVQLYEAFGITEAGMVCWNKPGCVRVGTVGQPAEPGSVTLAEDGEVIITRQALLSHGYFESTALEQRATFIRPHSVATGDIAQFDAAGFLTIVGRKKDAIVTRSGEKFHPESIETLIQIDPQVKVAVVTDSDTMVGTTAIICLEQPDDSEATQQVRRHINEINSRLPISQQVRNMIFTRTEFTIENGFRTKNLKLDRRAIRRHFVSEPIAPSAAAIAAN
jgi:long-chain acyl-CoA synthetase